MRIADNINATKGMKLWTWGYNNSYNTDPMTYGNSARPYIELCHLIEVGYLIRDSPPYYYTLH